MISKFGAIVWNAPRATHLMLLLATLMLAAPALAAAADTNGEISFLAMGTQMLGGLALFLFGIEQLTDSLKALAGDRLRVVLARLTTNRFSGAATGALVTAIIQSSSVTTVLVVGFTTAGLMSFAQSIGVIMGANIGTTITAQILAFKITEAAWAMVAVGFAGFFFARQETVKQLGSMILGLGLVFVGMSVMSDAMSPLRTYQPFLGLMVTMDSPLMAIGIAALFTGLIQSSSATTGIVIVMAGQGLISLPAGIALAFGANIGTCVTAMLAAIGKPREALRAAVVHVLFNVAGVMLWIMFIDPLAQLVTAISPVHHDLTGSARLAADTPRQIANAHTIFNISNTLVFIWLTPQLARLVEWLVPDRPLAEEARIRAKFLDDALLTTPSLALDRVRMELQHMGEHIHEMLTKVMPALLNGSAVKLRAIQAMDDKADQLYGLIVEYLGRISRLELSEKQQQEFFSLMEAVNNLENIGDLVEKELVPMGLRRLDHQIQISQATQQVLTGFHRHVSEAVDTAIQAVTQADREAADSVIDQKERVSSIVRSAEMHEARRLVVSEPNRLEAYTIEMEIVEQLQRVYYLAKRIAKSVRFEPKQLDEAAADVEQIENS